MASRSPSDKLPPISLKALDRGNGPRYYADFRHNGKRTTLAIGPAWLEADTDGRWRPRRGRVQEGYYDERTATVQAAAIVGKYLDDAADVERVEFERSNRGVTFRELSHAYLKWLKRSRTRRHPRCAATAPTCGNRARPTSAATARHPDSSWPGLAIFPPRRSPPSR